MALTDNLVAYYKMDGNSNDSVGSNNGTDTSMSYVTGKINQGASFNGSSSYINLPFNVDQANDYTCGFWFNTTNGSSGYLVDSAKNPNRFVVYLDTSKVTYWVKNNTIQTSTISTSTWYYVVVTKDGSTYSLYLNGTLVTTQSAGSATTTDNNTRLGASEDSAGAKYTGLIDEVGIWSRALSAAEVSQLYNSGAGLQYPFTTNKPSLFPFFNNYI